MAASQQIDFDLASYIAHRKGRVLQRARDGAAYGYSGEVRQRRNLVALRPVAFAIEVTARQWKGNAKTELLDGSTRANAAQHPRLYACAQHAAKSLSLENCPPVYVSDPSRPVGAWALGTDDDALLVVHPLWVDTLSEVELLAVVARTLGYVQNNLVPLSTAKYYLENDAFFFVRWMVAPALLALRSWAKRANISCDRAGLIATRNVGMAVASLLRTAGEYTGPLDYDTLSSDDWKNSSAISELVASNKLLGQRIEALHVFAKTYLYSQLTGTPKPEGLTTDRADEMVRELLSD